MCDFFDRVSTQWVADLGLGSKLLWFSVPDPGNNASVVC